jgi:hypothetical protein
MWRAGVPQWDSRYAPPESRIPTFYGNVERRCADIARWDQLPGSGGLAG